MQQKQMVWQLGHPPHTGTEQSIPHDGACPSAGGVHDSGQYPRPEGGGEVVEF
jgi:hypothetical protein